MLYDILHNVGYPVNCMLFYEDSYYIITAIDNDFEVVTLHEFQEVYDEPRNLTIEEFEKGLTNTDGLRHMIVIKEY